MNRATSDPCNSCNPDLVKRYLENQCTKSEQASLENHLSDCDRCRQQMQAEIGSDWEQARDFLTTDALDEHIDVVSLATATIGEEALEDTHAIQHDGLRRVLEMLAPTDDPRMLGRIGRYEIVGAIGFGGMAVVLKGFEPSLNRNVAIKVLAPHLAASKSARERFSREARAAASVLHPNVIAIHSVAEFQHLPYLVMPYIPGGSLRDRLEVEGKLDTSAVLRIGMQVAAGLAAAHEQGIVHRDIKPANVLLEPGLERAVITDFGLARAADDASITQTGILAGTPQYMSPEQAKGERLRQHSDLFSLGSLLFTLVTGRVPFQADTSYGVLRKIIETDAPDPRTINPDVPDWLARLIMRLHRREPSERFQSVSEVSELLRQCLAAVQQSGTPIPDTLLPPKRRFPLVPLLAGALLLCLAGGIAWRSSNTNNTPTRDHLSKSDITAPVSWPTDGKWATLRGRFVWEGDILPAKQVEVTREITDFPDPVFEESLVINKETKAVANVFVWLEDESLQRNAHKSYDAPLTGALLQFDRGRVEPHASILRTGQTIRIRNKDPVRHYMSFGSLMNVWLPPGKLFANEFHAQATPTRIACQFHPWIASHVLVCDHPYATVSSYDGSFELQKIPAGKWRLRVWHELLGEIQVSEQPCVAVDNGTKFLVVDRPGLELTQTLQARK